MNKIRLFAVAVTCAATMSVLTPSMSASLWDKRTIVTFSGAVEVPGTVLQPGRYIMKLVDTSAGNRHIVQFSNERENHVFATVIAIPAWRQNPSDKSVFTFYETPAGQPQAMRTWYYPGDNFGQEFVYPKDRMAALLAGVNRVDNSNTLAARPPEPPQTQVEKPAITEAPSSPAPVAEEKSSDTEQVTIAQNTAPEIENPPAPAPSDERVAAPAPETTYQTLPKTASDFWEIGLIGLGSLIAAGGVRKLRQS